MNTNIYRTVFICVASLCLTQSAHAADFSRLQVKLSGAINQDCLKVEGYDPVWGCFRTEFVAQGNEQALLARPVIYISSGLPLQLLPYVFMQNVGQFVLANYSDQELTAVFNPAPQVKDTVGIRTSAANSFALWALGGQITPAKIAFFKNELARR